jgi:vaccinia related kinase
VNITKKYPHLSGISRRGDFEVLLFNLIDWLGGRLPWDEEPQLKPKIIERMKIKAFSDIPKFLHTTFKTAAYPGTTRERTMNS